MYYQVPTPILPQKAHELEHYEKGLHPSRFSAYRPGEFWEALAHCLWLAMPQFASMCLSSGNSHEILHKNIVQRNEVLLDLF